jgi:cell wall assembly regulator SMI1
MDFVDQYPALTAADIEDVERSYGIDFPEDLRSHYLATNGGHPVNNAFPKNGEYYSIEDFLAIKYGDSATSFERTYETLILDNDRYPNNVIPFAHDASGDYFLYRLDDRKGEIWFFESEFYDDQDKAWTFLAKTFREFIDHLVSVPD